MKKIVLASCLLSATLLMAQSQSDPGAYLDHFSESYQTIQKDMWDYTKSVSHGRSARKVDKRRGELIGTSDSALKHAEKADGFQGDNTYRDVVVEYFRTINLVLKEDYAKLVDMEAVAEESYDAMEAYMTAKQLANDKQTDAFKLVSATEKEFAKNHNVTLIQGEQDKLDKKMEIADAVYTHYNEVYLIFFKSYKQELYMNAAIGSGDLSSIEQNREALKATTEEGLGKLSGVELFEGDKAMITATRQLFKFYQKEAENTQAAVDYYLKLENFNKIKTAFEAKKEKNRTQQDVDEYNNAVNEMNDAVNKYNEVNDANNKERSELIDNWNSTAEKFTNSHVPRGN